MNVKDAVGRFGEDAACRYLEARGLTIVDRNWRCRDGELDIVALDEGTAEAAWGRSELVVVEVKTRSSAYFGSPAEAVSPAKAARLRRLTARWIDEHPDRRGRYGIRIDVIAVLRSATAGPSDQPTIDHFIGAV